MKLYMMVTQDRYELPLCVTDSVKELAKFSGLSVDTLYQMMSKYKHGRIKKSRFIAVEVEK